MAILVRNLAANQQNALKLAVSDALCCGDTSPVTVHDYTLAINTGSVTAGTHIRIAGVTYAFPASYATTTEDGRQAIADAIAAQLVALGYVHVRVTVSFSTPTATFVVHNSQVVITGLNTSSNTFTQGAAKEWGIF